MRGIRLDIPILDDQCELGVIERDRDVAGSLVSTIPDHDFRTFTLY
jgi:hypothetical protein